ncbi:helix-turn-helix transcriptional regulator [Halomonas sp. MCCC 1A11036]|uniref:Helix-turn-helix transcriptional regulator n=1 Tax=Billgrantia zhangzhouensis TaxID=2733481 RepID=A0ABS9AKC2_9GAMM|nr:helix-turn-helix transcriptional regulator [Halomonas zhangzhouensis]
MKKKSVTHDAPSGAAELGSTLSDRLRACARIAGSGNALADKSGVARRTLENYFSGRSEPKGAALASIAKAVGVSGHWLLTGEGQMLLEELADPQYREPAVGSGIAHDFDTLEEVIAKTCALFKAKDIKLRPEAEAKVIRLIYEYYLRHGDAMDEATMNNVIALAAFR